MDQTVIILSSLEKNHKSNKDKAIKTTSQKYWTSEFPNFFVDLLEKITSLVLLSSKPRQQDPTTRQTPSGFFPDLAYKYRLCLWEYVTPKYEVQSHKYAKNEENKNQMHQKEIMRHKFSHLSNNRREIPHCIKD